MISINLLPWRERRRVHAYRKIKFLILIILLCSIGLIMGVYGYIHGRIYLQNQRNYALVRQISAINKKLQNFKIQNFLNKKFASQKFIAAFLYEFAKILSDEIYLTNLNLSGFKVTVEGMAKSDYQITAMMQNILHSSWFTEPKFIEIKHNKKFTISFIIRNPRLINSL